MKFRHLELKGRSSIGTHLEDNTCNTLLAHESNKSRCIFIRKCLVGKFSVAHNKNEILLNSFRNFRFFWFNWWFGSTIFWFHWWFGFTIFWFHWWFGFTV